MCFDFPVLVKTMCQHEAIREHVILPDWLEFFLCFVEMLFLKHRCSFMENSSLCTDIHELNCAYVITNFNFQAGYLIPQGFITLLHRCKNWFISQGNLVTSGMHYVLPATSIYLVSYSEPTRCFANAQAFPSRIALHYPLKMNYVFNPLIHLRYFQSCLIEYYDLLCVHVLICIWFGSPALADWPWSSLEEEKNPITSWQQYTNLRIYVY